MKRAILLLLCLNVFGALTIQVYNSDLNQNQMPYCWEVSNNGSALRFSFVDSAGESRVLHAQRVFVQNNLLIIDAIWFVGYRKIQNIQSYSVEEIIYKELK